MKPDLSLETFVKTETGGMFTVCDASYAASCLPKILEKLGFTYMLYWFLIVFRFYQVTTDVQAVLKACTIHSVDSKQLEEGMSLMERLPEAARLSSLLHLICLLFEVSTQVSLDKNYLGNDLKNSKYVFK